MSSEERILEAYQKVREVLPCAVIQIKQADFPRNHAYLDIKLEVDP